MVQCVHKKRIIPLLPSTTVSLALGNNLVFSFVRDLRASKKEIYVIHENAIKKTRLKKKIARIVRQTFVTLYSTFKQRLRGEYTLASLIRVKIEPIRYFSYIVWYLAKLLLAYAGFSNWMEKEAKTSKLKNVYETRAQNLTFHKIVLNSLQHALAILKKFCAALNRCWYTVVSYM